MTQDESESSSEAATWNVWRQGDDGNEFIVDRGLTKQAADERVAELESHGHKQLYWSRKESS